MNVHRLITMLMRRFGGRALRSGTDMVARKGKAPADMSPTDRQAAQSAKKTTRNARKMMRLSRRIGRF